MARARTRDLRAGRCAMNSSFLTRRKRYKLPLTPPQMTNHGNFIISLGQLIPILGAEAEQLGVDVFAGFAAAEALFDATGAVKGVRIGDMGVEKNGEPGPEFRVGSRKSTPR